MKSYYGIDDERLPDNPKPVLQQYDNYQIYDIHCVDINTQVYGSYSNYQYLYVSNGAIFIPEPPSILANNTIEQTSFLAVQVYHPVKILCDFNEIIQSYP